MHLTGGSEFVTLSKCERFCACAVASKTWSGFLSKFNFINTRVLHFNLFIGGVHLKIKTCLCLNVVFFERHHTEMAEYPFRFNQIQIISLWKHFISEFKCGESTIHKNYVQKMLMDVQYLQPSKLKAGAMQLKWCLFTSKYPGAS